MCYSIKKQDCDFSKFRKSYVKQNDKIYYSYTKEPPIEVNNDVKINQATSH